MRLLHYKYVGLVIALLIIGHYKGKAQCSLGQTPESAFTLCGLGSFQMATVPLCQGQVMVVPGCYSFFSLSDRNAFWYKFTCYTAGTLGFVITPINALDDYDWQLFDVTGADARNVYTVSSLVVTGNWADTYGNTGASATGVPYIGCASEILALQVREPSRCLKQPGVAVIK